MASEQGVKYDGGKLRWGLLPLRPVIEILKVLMFGAEKYSADNWQNVPEPRRRYFEAAQRHIWAWWGGETDDPESGLHHLAHAGCCILFLLWFELGKGSNENKEEH